MTAFGFAELSHPSGATGSAPQRDPLAMRALDAIATAAGDPSLVALARLDGLTSTDDVARTLGAVVLEAARRVAPARPAVPAPARVGSTALEAPVRAQPCFPGPAGSAGMQRPPVGDTMVAPRPSPPAAVMPVATGGLAVRARAVAAPRPSGALGPPRPIGAPMAVRPVRDPAGITARRARTGRIATWVRNAGLLVIALLVYQLWGTGFEQHRAQAQMRATFQRALSAQPAGPAPTVAPAGQPPGSRTPTVAATPVPPPALPGGVVARIQIPVIHVDQFVVDGTTDADLRRGVGHYTGSPLPGRPGNVAMAGHRTTYGAPFNRLGDLRPGDTIIASTLTGRFLYVVASKMNVWPSQTSVLDDYGDNRLTLTTCTPEFSATQRLVVVAELVGPAPPAVPARTTAPAPAATTPRSVSPVLAAHLRASVGRGFDLSRLPAVALIVVLLAGLGVAYRPVRALLPPVASVAVLAPLWAFAVLMLCEQLTRFLPPYV